MGSGTQWRTWLSIVAMVGLSASLARAADMPSPDQIRDLAKEAYIYSFPLYVMAKTRAQAISRPYVSGVNRFQHARNLAGPGNRAVTGPNNDTIYSSAWLDLAGGPLVMHVPDTAGRYYSLAFMDFYTNNFAYVGRRTTGTKAGDYLIAGPGWSGAPPAGMPVIHAPTNDVWLLGRFLVDGPSDLPAVHALQDSLSLKPLGIGDADGGRAFPAIEADDPLNFFAVVDVALTRDPPPADEAPLMAKFVAIDVGPGKQFDAKRFSQPERDALLAGVAEGKQTLQAAGTASNAPAHAGWSRPRAEVGDFGKNYGFRAVVALVGLAALAPAEAMYFQPTGDSEGRPLTGAARYLLHFPAGQLPPVDAFWSLTAYAVEADRRHFLVANPIDRYSIGDRTKGLQYNSDGSLDIYIQHASPGPAHEANWLPAPEGEMYLSMRAYQPKAALLNGSYTLPALKRLD